MRNTVPTAYTAVPTGVTVFIGHVRRNQWSRYRNPCGHLRRNVGHVPGITGHVRPEYSKANLQALEGFTAQAFAAIEKLVDLNLTAAKATLTDSFSHVQAVLGAKDAQELIALVTSVEI